MHSLLLELSLIKVLLQKVQPQTLQKPQKASVLKDGHCLIKLRLTDKETSQAFSQFWAGITAMVRSMRRRTGSGGGVRPIMVLDGTACIPMVVAYIPTTASAAMGAMCGVSRLHKLIPVYSFYSYWRIREQTPHAIASAGTIVNKNASDDSGNLNTAAESICPKGWTLPTTKQLDSQRDITNFFSVLGGDYINGVLNNETTRGSWWSSEVYNVTARYYLYYNGNSLHTGSNTRRGGIYIRCVSEEKTVTDLTYLQDMTGEIADNTLDGTTVSLTGRKSPQTRYLQHHSSFILQ